MSNSRQSSSSSGSLGTRRLKTWIIKFDNGETEEIKAHQKDQSSDYVVFERYSEGSHIVVWRKEFYKYQIRSIEWSSDVRD